MKIAIKRSSERRLNRIGKGIITAAFAFIGLGVVAFVALFLLFGLGFISFLSANLSTNVVGNVQVPSSCQQSLSNTAINFGSVPASTSTSTSNLVVDTNGGNLNSWLWVYGANWVSTTNSAINFFVANTDWNPTSLGSFAGNALTLTSANSLILIPSGGSTNNIFYGVNVPSGQTANTYNQNIVMLNTC